MSKQLYEVGDTLQAGANTLVATAVSFRDTEDGGKERFAYTFRDKKDLDEEAQAAKAAEVAAAENAKLAATEGADNTTAGESEEA